MRRAVNGSQSNDRIDHNKRCAERIPFAHTLLYGCIAALLTAPPLALAAPQGGDIVGGTGSISTSGTTTVVQQQTTSMAIDWQSFNLAADETVKFVQPSATSVVLNRILDQNPSQIFGTIDANGRVFLSNPNGLVFGETATINAGSFVASGLDISVDDFMAGKYDFGTAGIDGGGVINHGLIAAAEGGSVALVGSHVSNQGVILANYGTVNMGAAQTAVIDFDGDGLMTFQVAGAVSTNATGAASAVDNQGKISALGGQIFLTASAAQDVFSHVINNDGILEAGRIDNSGGVVRLVGIGQGEVRNSGTIDVSGQDASSTGGTVELLGDEVGLFGSSTIDASGQTGGGKILIGGDKQGSNPEITNASAVYLGQDSVTKADATQSGDGGEVIVFADGSAKVYGSISAKGGVLGGNGGYVETSGKQYFTIANAPDLSASQGTAGEWLIDPDTLTIVSTSGSLDSSFTSPSSSPYGFDVTADPTISTDTLNNALLNGATVTIYTSSAAGSITLDKYATLDYQGDSNATLNLIATGNITIDGKILDSSTLKLDSLNLNLMAQGDILVNSTGSIYTNGGEFTAQGYVTDFSSPPLSTTNYANSVVVNGDINTISATSVPSPTDSITMVGKSVTANANLTSTAINVYADTPAATAIDITNNAASGGTVNMTAVAGDISYIQSAGNVEFGNVTANSGAINLENDVGNITISGIVSSSSSTSAITVDTTLGSGDVLISPSGLISGGKDVNINSAGSIQSGVDNSGTTPVYGEVDAIGTLTLNAAYGIGSSTTSLQTNASTITATSTKSTYGIYINDTGSSVTFNNISAKNADISLRTTTGDMTIEGQINTNVCTSGSCSTKVSLNSGANLYTMSDGSGGTLGASILSTNLDLIAKSNIGSSEASPFYILGSSIPTFGAISASNIYLKSDTDLVLGSATKATGVLDLYSAKTISNVSGASVDANDVYLKSDATSGTAINLAFTDSTGINLHSATTKGGDVSLTNQGGITVADNITASGNIALTTSVGGILLNKNITATNNTIKLVSASDIQGSGILSTGTSGLVDLTAGTGINDLYIQNTDGSITYNPINIDTTQLYLTNNGSGVVSVKNSNTNLLNINSIDVCFHCEVDIETAWKYKISSSSIANSNAPMLSLTTDTAGSIDWNKTGVYWLGYMMTPNTNTYIPYDYTTDLVIDNTTLGKLGGLTLGTNNGSISADGVGINYKSTSGSISPLLDVGLKASGSIYFLPSYQLSNAISATSVLSENFNSLTAKAGTNVIVQSTINTITGDISLTATSGGLTIGSNTSTIQNTLNSGKGITLSASDSLTLNGNLVLDTTKTSGSIDLSQLDIESGSSTSTYSLSLKAGSGDISLGTIGTTSAVNSVYTETSGTLYLCGDITVNGTAGNVMDFGNASQIVLKKITKATTPTYADYKITLTSKNGGVINLGLNSLGTTPVPTPLYSVYNSNGNLRDSLYINNYNGGVIFGPVGQTPPNLLAAQLEGWGQLQNIQVGQSGSELGAAVLFGNVSAIDNLQLLAASTSLSTSSVNLAAKSVTIESVNGQTTPSSLSFNSNETHLLGDINVANNIDLSNSLITYIGSDISLLSNTGTITLNGTIQNDPATIAQGGLLTISAQNGGVQLAGDVTTNTNGVIFDNTSISGTGALTINALNNGPVTLYKIGDTTNRIKYLTIEHPSGSVSAVTLGGDIATRDGVSIKNSPITLTHNVSISTVDSAVDLTNSSVDGASKDGYSLSISTGAGNISLGNVGTGSSGELYSLTLASTGITTISTSQVTGWTNGGLHTSSGIDMSGATTVNFTNNSDLYGQTIKLNGGTVNGPGGLSVYLQNGDSTSPVSGGGGTVSFGVIGQTTPLAYLNIYGDLASATADFAGNINSSGIVNLAGDGTYGLSAVNFNGDAVVTAPKLYLPNLVNAAGNLDLTNAQSVDFTNTTPDTTSTSGVSATVTATGTISTYGSVLSNGTLNFTSSGGSILLGDINLGTNSLGTNNLNNFNASAPSGDILNNRGISDPSNPLNNITAYAISLSAGNRIGVSTTDPIVIYVPGQITLSFGAPMAYIRNMYGAPVTNLGGGTVIDIIRNSLLSSEQSVSLWNDGNSQDTSDSDNDKKDKEEKKTTTMVTWLDNTRSPDVPRMIRTPDAWVFTRNNEYYVPAAETVTPAADTVTPVTTVKHEHSAKKSAPANGADKGWSRDQFKY